MINKQIRHRVLYSTAIRMGLHLFRDAKNVGCRKNTVLFDYLAYDGILYGDMSHIQRKSILPFWGSRELICTRCDLADFSRRSE